MPTTKHYDIFDYWKDKSITMSGEVRVRSVDRRNDEVPVVFDWGEPECWACGRRMRKEWNVQKKSIGEDGNIDLERLWNSDEVKHNYERCHIIARSLGGPDNPENLFIMCPECHLLSPDTSNTGTFFRWVYRRRAHYADGWPIVEDVIADADVELCARGLPDVLSMVRYIYERIPDADLGYKSLREFSKKRITLHMTTMSVSSAVGIFCDFLEYWYNKANELV